MSAAGAAGRAGVKRRPRRPVNSGAAYPVRRPPQPAPRPALQRDALRPGKLAAAPLRTQRQAPGEVGERRGWAAPRGSGAAGGGAAARGAGAGRPEPVAPGPVRPAGPALGLNLAAAAPGRHRSPRAPAPLFRGSDGARRWGAGRRRLRGGRSPRRAGTGTRRRAGFAGSKAWPRGLDTLCLGGSEPHGAGIGARAPRELTPVLIARRGERYQVAWLLRGEERCSPAGGAVRGSCRAESVTGQSP